MKIMLSKIWKWVNDNKTILLLVFIAIFILGYPLFAFEINKSFYFSFDPDVVYTTNALLFAKTRIISYFDHPGTPSILLFSYLFIPLRLIAKYVLHQGFIQWAFENYAFLTFYLRIFQLTVTGGALFLFLKLVDAMSKSKIIVIFAFLLIFSLGTFSWAIAIGPEAFSLFLTTIWLIVFTKFLKSPKYAIGIIMVLISGIALANKLTNLSLVIFAVLLPIFIQKMSTVRKFIAIFVNLLLFSISYAAGIWYVLYNLKYIIAWGRSLFLHTEKYGGGAAKIFDWNSYSSSVGTLIQSSPVVFIFIVLAIVLVIGLMVGKRIKTNDRAVIFLFSAGLIGFIVFSKYPTIHYNYVNLLLIVYCVVYFVLKLKIVWVKVLLPALMAAFIFTSFNYIIVSQMRIKKNQPENIYQVLEDWTPTWSADLFREQLDVVKKP